MSAVNKKSVLVSAGTHLLLIVVLFVGPAFLVTKKQVNDMPVLDVIPENLIDQALFGGKPAAQPPPAPQPKPEPPPVRPKPRQPDPEPPRRPEPKPVPKKPVRSEPKWKPVKPKINLSRTSKTPVRPTRSTPAKTTRLTDTVKSLRSKLSSTTSIQMPTGGLDSGPAFANYAQAIKTLYQKAWLEPSDAQSDTSVVKARVRIARDGRILSAVVVGRSSDAAVNRSVEQALRRVTKAPPFPAGSKDKERSYTINFELSSRRLG